MNQGVFETLQLHKRYLKMEKGLREVERAVGVALIEEKDDTSNQITRILNEWMRDSDFVMVTPPLDSESRLFKMLQTTPGFIVWNLVAGDASHGTVIKFVTAA